MHSKTRRLYGDKVDPTRWADKKYIDVLNIKIKLASERIKEINLQPISTRDHYGITECMNAIKFCREFIKETQDVRDNTDGDF